MLGHFLVRLVVYSVIADCLATACLLVVVVACQLPLLRSAVQTQPALSPQG